MTGSTAGLSVQEFSEKLVQQIAQRGDEIPEMYIEKDGFQQAIDGPEELWNDTLLIDLSLLSSSDDRELAKLKAAFSDWGCLQLVNHGLERSVIDEVVEVSKQFFELPLEEKVKSTPAEDIFNGYGSQLGVIQGTTGRWMDRLYLALLPEDDRNLQLWPQKPDKFREIIDKYIKNVETSLEVLYKAMARSLNIKEDSFLKLMKQGSIFGGLNLYPRCPLPERVMGLKAHKDRMTPTVVLQEPGVGGLEVQKDDQWFKVPAIPGALFIILGDMGQVMSNGIFQSSMHRVATNSSKDRISWAAFHYPEGNTEVGPIDELVTADRPQQYKKFKLIEFRKRMFELHRAGRVTIIDELKL